MRRSKASCRRRGPFPPAPHTTVTTGQRTTLSTADAAQSREKNKSRDEVRTLLRRPVTAEAVCFPAAAQAAVLHREVSTRQPETVYLLSSAPPERLPAERWLQLNRGGWGIENGLHQRLDVTAQEDRSRVRQRNAVRVLGMFRRLGISLFMHWRAQSPKRLRASLRDFHDTMHLNHQRHAFHLVAAAKPLASLS